MKNRILSFLLSLLLLLTCALTPMSEVYATGDTTRAVTTIASGECGFGIDVRWTLNSDGTLIISGTGKVTGYETGEYPWHEYSDQVKKLIVNSGIVELGEGAFTYMIYLSEVELNTGLISIGTGAFWGCMSLKSVTLPNTVVSIGDGAFMCPGLESITLSSKLTTIGAQAFYGTEKLKKIVIPDSVTTIGEGAFAESGITEVTIGKSVKTLPANAFSANKNLKSITASSKNPNFSSDNSGILYNKKKTKLIRYPEGKGPADVKIVSSVKTVGTGAFYGSKVKTVQFPSALTSLEPKAFANCSQLFSAIFLGDAPTTFTKDVFSGVASNFRICYYFNRFNWSEPTWNGFPSVSVGASEINDGSVKNPETKYYHKRSFYINDVTDSVIPANAYVKVDGQTFKQEHTSKYYAPVYAQVEQTYKGNITVGAPGFYEYTIPQEYFTTSNYVDLIPASDKGILLHSFLLYGYDQFKTSTEVFYKADISHNAVTCSFYPVVDWNGHGEGKLYLRQGNTKLELKNRTNNKICVAEEFDVGTKFYLQAVAADGTVKERAVKIEVKERTNSNLSLDLGDTITADTSKSTEETLDVFGEETFKLSGSLLDKFPVSIAYSENGMVHGTIGFTLAKGDNEKAAFGNFKSSLQQLKSATTKEQKESAINRLKEMTAMNNLPVRASSIVIEGNVQVVGYFSGIDNGTSIQPTQIQIAFISKGSLGYEYKFYTWVGVVPIKWYWGVEASAEVKTWAPLSYNAKSNQLEMASSVPFNAEVNFSGEFGTGHKDVLSFGPRGRIQYLLDARLPFVKKDVTMSMKGNLYLVFTFLGLECEGKVCATDEYIFFQNNNLCWVKKSKNRSVLRMGTDEASEFAINTSRSYMQQSNSSDGTFITDVSGYNTPAFTVLNDGRMLAVWVADDETRDAADKNAIYYSLRSTDGIWSETMQIENDGTLDSEPRLFDLDGDIWVTWQNYSETYGDTYPEDLSQLAEQMKVTVARYNQDTNSFEEITDFNIPGADLHAKMSISDDSISVAWNSSTNITSEDPSYSQYSSTYGESGWTTPVSGNVSWYEDDASVSLPDDYEGEWPSMASEPLVVTDGDVKAVLYVSLDDEGNRTLSAITNDGNGWGQQIDLLEVSDKDDIGNFSAEIYNGELKVLTTTRNYNSDGSIANADLKVLELPITADLCVDYVEYDKSTLNAGGDLSILATVSNQGSAAANGIDITLKNGSTVLHSERIGTQILSGDKKTLNISYTLPDTVSYTEIVCEVAPVNIVDNDSTNNSGICKLLLADAMIEYLSAETVDNGVLVTTSVFNNGMTDLNNINLQLRKDAPDGQILVEKTMQAADGSTSFEPNTSITDASFITSGLSKDDVVYAVITTDAEENYVTNNELGAVVYENEPVNITEEPIEDTSGFGPDDVYRISGEDRYLTSFKSAKAYKTQLGVDKFDTAIIACGTNFADALAGSYLAGVKNAPVIMANDSIVNDLSSYLEKNLKENGTIYILGGINAVSTKIENTLKTSGTIKRLGGKDRYETNLLILKEAGVTNEDILICTGTSFADSLSASALGKPILLVGNNLTDVQKTYLDSLSGNKYYIIGGTNAVKTTIEQELKVYGGATRLGGETRYETSVLVAETFFTNPDTAVLTYAMNFPDGLSGGPLAMFKNAPMILTSTNSPDAARDYMQKSKITKGAVLGGPILISDEVVKSIFGTDTITLWP